MLVVVCCGCVLCCGRVFYPFCRVEHPTKGDISPHFNAITNAKLLPPSPADKSPCTVDASASVKMGGGAVRLGLRFEGRKYAFFAH